LSLQDNTVYILLLCCLGTKSEIEAEKLFHKHVNFLPKKFPNSFILFFFVFWTFAGTMDLCWNYGRLHSQIRLTAKSMKPVGFIHAFAFTHIPQRARNIYAQTIYLCAFGLMGLCHTLLAFKTISYGETR
jgi:hypothetical protein